MSNLIAIAYPDEATARDVVSTLQELQKEKTISYEDLVIAVREDNGKVKLRQSFSPAGAGAAGGALWGGLIGLIFLAPLVGMAIGAASGAAAGKMTDVGVDDSFMKNLGDKLPAGSAALVVLGRSDAPDKVIDRVKGYGGHVMQTSLAEEQEENLRAALGETAATA